MDIEVKPNVGDFLEPDGWRFGENLLPGDGGDGGFPGCAFRVPAGDGLYKLAVNVSLSGRKPRNRFRDGRYWYRARIEFVGDGEPSTFANGWLFCR